MVASTFIGRLRKIGRLWRQYAFMDVLWITRVPKLFLINYICDTIMNIAAVTAMLLLAQRFDGFGVWTKYQVVFMLGYAMIANGLVETFFGYNILVISRRLGRGQFDHVLLQPQPVWLGLLTEGFLPFSSSALLVPGLGLMIWACAALSLPVTPLWLGLLCLNLVASAGVVMSFAYLWGTLAFWAPRAAEEISSSSLELINQLKSFPLDGLGPALVGGLLTILPVGLVAWYPCRYLVGVDQRPWAGLVTPLAAVLLGACAGFVFKKGMGHYARSGSQRYLSFGHRR